MLFRFKYNALRARRLFTFRISYSQVAAIIERNVVLRGRASILHAWNEHAFRVLPVVPLVAQVLRALRVYILQFATPLPTTSSSTAVNKYTKIVPPMLLFK